MSFPKSQYTFKDKTWYIIPWRNIDTYTPASTKLPSILVHDVAGYNPHRIVFWAYTYLENDNNCSICRVSPSKRIQTLWTLENLDNPLFYEET